MTKKSELRNIKSARSSRNILGVNISITQEKKVLDLSLENIKTNKKFFIVTPNPEILLEASRDSEYKDILNNASLAIPDGVGLTYASQLLYGKSLRIIPGRQLFIDLLNLANRNSLKVFFLGSTDQVIQKSLSKARSQFVDAKFGGISGPKVNKQGVSASSKIEADAISEINKFRPDILFVAFGHPKQEKWVARNISKLNANVIMTVGGALDYYSGKNSVPPKWLSNLGFEWLWRLANDPKRYRRICNAVFVFTILILKEKAKNLALK